MGQMRHFSNLFYKSQTIALKTRRDLSYFTGSSQVNDLIGRSRLSYKQGNQLLAPQILCPHLGYLVNRHAARFPDKDLAKKMDLCDNDYAPLGPLCGGCPPQPCRGVFLCVIMKYVLINLTNRKLEFLILSRSGAVTNKKYQRFLY
jgi:hypothetical protein